MTTCLSCGLTEPYTGMLPAALKHFEALITTPILSDSPSKEAVRLSKKPLCYTAKWLLAILITDTSSKRPIAPIDHHLLTYVTPHNSNKLTILFNARYTKKLSVICLTANGFASTSDSFETDSEEGLSHSDLCFIIAGKTMHFFDVCPCDKKTPETVFTTSIPYPLNRYVSGFINEYVCSTERIFGIFCARPYSISSTAACLSNS